MLDFNYYSKLNRGAILLFVTAAAMFALYYGFIRSASVQEEISQRQLFDLIKAGKVESMVNQFDPASGKHSLIGNYKRPVSPAPGANEIPATFKVPVDLAFNKHLIDDIRNAGYTEVIETQNNTSVIWPIIVQFLPLLLCLAVAALFYALIIFFLIKLLRWSGMTKT